MAHRVTANELGYSSAAVTRVSDSESERGSTDTSGTNQNSAKRDKQDTLHTSIPHKVNLYSNVHLATSHYVSPAVAKLLKKATPAEGGGTSTLVRIVLRE
jgi:hypothetical protein